MAILNSLERKFIMVASVRHTSFTNTTGAVVVAGGATVEKGQDYGLEVVSRTLAAVDIGDQPGETQDAAGMIFAEFKGVVIKCVTSLEVFRVAGGITYAFYYLIDERAYPGYSITTANGVSTLNFQDGATAAGNGLLVAGDIVRMTVAIGNS
ncbi:MAG: hypothetical protein QN834_09895 [Nitrososphaeraceae archaeon]|nr:hypothetical protein [Nitrososphaeraceae archaeon]